MSTVPTGAPIRSSFFVDDLPNAPVGPGEAVGWYQFADNGEYHLIDPFDWPEYFVISVPATNDSPKPTDPLPTVADRPVDVSAIPLSAFTTRFEKVPGQVYTVEEWLSFIRDGAQAKTITAIRDSRGTPRYDFLKRQLPCASFAGTFPLGRAGKFPSNTSGMLFLEVDFHDGAPPEGWLESERARLSAHPAVVTIYASAGGAGLHAVVAVDPVPVDRQSYRQAWAWATRELVLENTGDPLVKDSTRLACISHDPGLYVNMTPQPLRWRPNALSGAGRKAQEGARQRTPDDLAQAFRLIAAHFGVGFEGVSDADCETGLRMPCVYHGGDNETSLHVWLGQRDVTDKKGKTQAVPTLYAKCHSQDCPGPVVLRFVAREAGIKWPITSGVRWSAQPMDAVNDTLGLLRLDIRMNRGTGYIEVRPWDGFEPDRMLADAGIPYRRGWVNIGGTVFDKALRLLSKDSFDISGTAADWTDALLVTASASPHSGFPFRDDFLEQLDGWDGVSRLDALFRDALGAENTELNRTAARAFLVGAIRRTYEPGAVHDWMPVLVGEQGLGKSRFLRALLPPAMELEQYAENLDLSQSPQQIAEGIGGAVIAEFSEMAGIKSVRATEGFKSFLSARNDRYRRPYHHEPSSNPRMWVGAGTANDEAIPADPSGSRRYAAVQCGAVADWEYVPKVRNQLWAEALALYNDWLADGSPNPPPNLLPPELREAQEVVNAWHTGGDATMESLVDALEPVAGKYVGWANAAVLMKLWDEAHRQRAYTTSPGTAFSIPPFGKPEQTRFGAALGQVGWRKDRHNGRPHWFR